MPQSKKMKVTGQKQQPWESSNVKKATFLSNLSGITSGIKLT